MRTKIVALVAGALITGLAAGAHAQMAETSLVDHTKGAVAASAEAVHSPGTVGAMNAVAHGVAASSEDVWRQQQGRSSASDGDLPIVDRHAMAVGGGSPGTVGAMPGN